MIVDIRPLDPADGDLVAAFQRHLADVDAHDTPWADAMSLRNVAGMLRHGFDGEAPRYVVGASAGQLLAAGGIWASDLDNLDNAWLQITVHPDHRGAGHGQAMLEHLEAMVGASGRHTVGTDCWDSLPLTEPLARRGYAHVYTNVCRRLTLDARAAARRDAACEHAASAPAAGDYELVRAEGALPHELIGASIAARTALNDAPTEGLVVEDEVFTAERIRGYEHAQSERGMRVYQILAIHRPTGAGAGHTIVAVDRDAGRASQHDTSVVPGHRGHRLGLRLKSDMLRWLAQVEPTLDHIDTFNAQSNDHMISVNEALGFVPMQRGLAFQRRLGGS